MKISKQWRQMQNIMTSEIGIWNQKDDESTIYKISKIEDLLRRKLFIKKDKKWKQKEYIRDKQNINIQIQSRTQSLKGIQNISLEMTNENIENDDFNFEKLKDQNIKFNKYCEYITQKGSYFGKLKMTNSLIIFESINEQRGKDSKFQFGSSEYNMLKKTKRKQWKIKEIIQLFSRRFNLQESISIEFFTIKQKSYYICLYTQANQNKFIDVLQYLNNKINIIQNCKKEFEKQGYQDKWIKNEISNFEYLMLINTYSGRTYNDLGQYFIFPWILNEYKCKNIYEKNKFNKSFFRDLSKPMGKINDNLFQEFKLRCKQMEDFLEDQPENYFLYGSLYSNPGVAIQLLIRYEPFTTLHYNLQSKKFDKPDRIFRNIDQQWQGSLKINNSELIPEFYYFSEFLRNRNKLELGILQNGNIVNDVILPNWVISQTYEEFIFVMRQALESQEVSKNLPSWIDLIFGYKAQYQEAINHDNLYTYYSYQENFEIDKKDQILAHITAFGQIPQQIFDIQHKKYKYNDEKEEDLTFYAFNPASLINFGQFSNSIENIFYSEEKGIYCMTITHTLTFYPLSRKLHWIKINANKMNNQKIDFHFDKLNDQYNIVKFKQYFFVSGFYECDIKVLNFDLLKIIQNIKFHKKPVTCMDISADGTILVLGSKDCRISIWKLYEITNNYQEKILNNDPDNILYGHHSEIQIIKTNIDLNIIFSIDIMGLCIIHSLRANNYLKNFVLDLQQFEYAKKVDFHLGTSFILIFTNVQKLFLYTINGNQYLQVNLLINKNDDNLKITDICFYKAFQSDIYFSTQCGKILSFDLFKIKQLQQEIEKEKNYKILNVTLQNCRVNIIDSISENILKDDCINSMLFVNYMANNTLICGYKSGNIHFFCENITQTIYEVGQKIMEMGFD